MVIKQTPEFERKWRDAFSDHRSNAASRGVAFELTFNQWLNIWGASGHLDQRGCRRDQYCMSRFGDVGPYAIGNVAIILHAQNSRDGRSVVTNHEVTQMSTTALQKKLDGLWTVQELCQMTQPNVTPMTIHLWRAHRALPAIVIRGDKRPAVRFVPADIRRWAKKNRVAIAA